MIIEYHAFDYECFRAAPREYAPMPLWFWNVPEPSALNDDTIVEILNKCYDSGYRGLGIDSFFIKEYLGDVYMQKYRLVVEECARLGMKLCLYDENGNPSGTAYKLVDGGSFVEKYPNDVLKALVKHEFELDGPATGVLRLPDKTATEPLMGIAAVNLDTNETLDLTDNCTGQNCSYDLGCGRWRIMIFMLRMYGAARCDCLDPDAVCKFIGLTYQKYYDAFKEYFGTVFLMAFYDEPALFDNNIWTGKFNDKFKLRYGHSPVKYYPALYYDIGPDTAAFRNMLWGFRSDLYADGWVKTIRNWCFDKKLQCTGHNDQEEILNPVFASGDLMKLFRNQDVPGLDEVIFYGRIHRAIKVVSSSAHNWDKDRVMVEIHGATNDISVDTMFRDLIDHYAMGVNLFIPHAVWYDPSDVVHPPELSWRTEPYASILPTYNDYVSRCSYTLTGGRHIADIGILYPIATLQADICFTDAHSAPYDYYKGGVVPKAEWNYMDIGQMLTRSIRRDFTFLHPDIIDERCTVEGDTFKLNNAVNYETYKVIIIPGGNTISLKNLKKIEEFYFNGGKVVGVRQLPYLSSEPGCNAEVRSIIQRIFGIDPMESAGPIFTASSFHDPYWKSNEFGYEPWKAGDGDPSTRWEAWKDGDNKDNTGKAMTRWQRTETGGDEWLEVDFGCNVEVGRVFLNEYNQSVYSFSVEWRNGVKWETAFSGESIGAKKTVVFTTPVITSRIRLFFSMPDNRVSISEFSLYDIKGNNLIFPKVVENTNDAGGQAVYIPNASAEILKAALDSLLPDYDVNFDERFPINLPGGFLSYIHKVKGDTDIYFIGNSSDELLRGHVDLRGGLIPMMMDPHTGSRSLLKYERIEKNEQMITRVYLDIEPIKSIFITGTA